MLFPWCKVGTISCFFCFVLLFFDKFWTLCCVFWITNNFCLFRSSVSVEKSYFLLRTGHMFAGAHVFLYFTSDVLVFVCILELAIRLNLLRMIQNKTAPVVSGQPRLLTWAQLALLHLPRGLHISFNNLLKFNLQIWICGSFNLLKGYLVKLCCFHKVLLLKLI